MVRAQNIKEDCLLSCDWGTSSFRLRLVDIRNGKIAGIISTRHGVSFINEKHKQCTASDRYAAYLTYLQRSIDRLSVKIRNNCTGVPVVISGMASSSIGLKELPYAHLPFSLSGSGITSTWIKSGKKIRHDILLISGVKIGNDVMRGEETQLIGLTDLVPYSHRKRIFILPGTHSKHVIVYKNSLRHFSTFLTGEVFAILRRYSVLRFSVEEPQSEITNAQRQLFLRGVLKSRHTDVLQNLFQVRQYDLTREFSKADNYYFLSGLLIGAELKTLAGAKHGIVLCCEGLMHDLYRSALECLDLMQHTYLVPSHVMTSAVVQGHIKIFKKSRINFSCG
ncbi:2-dehydro-3-deoxygalactonokinase [Niabella aurantiaca]|uniref:2-dehydro-3-deoxygalactonokinase n=1 Tax=Niabella aurantiaca TaxID=379900 RepID=UPI00039F9D34|nr:2-dehydro-3-deoxygalactonokinase [Niabella aurantiaca]